MPRSPGPWRAWIAALLLLSLPLQGLAAACMLGCGQSGAAAMMGAATATPNASAHDHHGHGTEMLAHADGAGQGGEVGHHAHQPAGQASADDPTGGPAGDAPSSASAPSDSDSGCSACAACFVGAAMPACERAFSAQAPGQVVSAAHAPTLADTSPRGLERPPRSAGA